MDQFFRATHHRPILESVSCNTLQLMRTLHGTVDSICGNKVTFRDEF